VKFYELVAPFIDKCNKHFYGYFLSTGTARLVNNSLANKTYSVCEGAELNMSASFIAVPGISMSWYHLPETRRYVHNDRYSSYGTVYYTTYYHIPYVYRYMLDRTYLVEATNFEGPRVAAYVEVVRESNCSGTNFQWNIYIIHKQNIKLNYTCLLTGTVDITRHNWQILNYLHF
jgi:hypothetical protein